MKKLLTIKTKRLEKAINKYFEVKSQNKGLFKNSAEKDSIEDEICIAARKKHKGVEIAPGCIVLKTKTKHIWIVLPSNFYTVDWIIKEDLWD